MVAAEGPRDLSEWPSTAPSEDGRSGIVEYTVQAGDTLWAIAERFYGTGAEFPRLVAANAGRAMPDGAVPGPGGWNRIHLITDDLDAEIARLEQEGVKFRNEVVSGPGGRQILVEDPAGNLVELFQPAG